ncbi:hypothetical protein BREVNS_1792 [Brevinematales bacterium NS]|nr:hypothetical protein BREVNS_1792 [Brevinematales bacterium NS]
MRKPGVRHGGLFPGGYRRERGYRLFFQPAPWETGRWLQKPPQGRGRGFQKGRSPFCPARERFFRSQEDKLWLPKSRGRGNVAHEGRTSSRKRRYFSPCPQKRPIVRPRRMHSMRRGQRFFCPSQERFVEKKKTGHKNSPQLREKIVEEVFSVCVKITVLYECGTALHSTGHSPLVQRSHFSLLSPLHECAKDSKK